MLKFKIDEKEFQLPDYLTIENYVKIFKLKDLFNDEYFAAKLINSITGVPVEDLLSANYQDINYITSYLLSLMPLETPKFVDRFELDGVHYGFFPNWQDLSYAEFVDMDTISTKKQDELLNMLHILCAVMYRPITEEKSQHDFKIEKYNVDSMKERAEVFKKKLDVKYILGAQFFFINYARKYLSYTQLSSMKKLSLWTKIKIVWTLRKLIRSVIFSRPLDGSWSQTELLETILQSTNISTKKT